MYECLKFLFPQQRLNKLIIFRNVHVQQVELWSHFLFEHLDSGIATRQWSILYICNWT